MDDIITPRIHPLAGEDFRDIVKIIIGEEIISLTELEVRLCDDYAQEIVIGESKISLINCLWRIDEFFSIVLNDGLIDRSYQATGSMILNRILRGDCFYDVVKISIGEEEIALMQLKRYLRQDVIIDGEAWSVRSIVSFINRYLREYKTAFKDDYEKELKKKRDELRSRLIPDETAKQSLFIDYRRGKLNIGKLIDKNNIDEFTTLRIPAGKLEADADDLIKKRLVLRKKLLEEKKLLVGGEPERYSTPTEFLNEVNQFQKFIERYFLTEEIFGEFGEKFPIESYMRIYDKIRLFDVNQKFGCTYIRDGLGGWMNILAINKSDVNLEESIKNIIPEHFKNPSEKSIEKWGKLKKYLDSLSAKKYVFTSFSEMGCIQYLHFIEFGEAFAFEWHAAPLRKYILTSISDIYSIANRFSDMFWEIYGDTDSLMKSFKCDDDIKPSIVLRGDKCSIEWVEFHTHEGVFQRKYEIDKTILRRNSFDGIAVPGNIKLVNDICHLKVIPKFRY